MTTHRLNPDELEEAPAPLGERVFDGLHAAIDQTAERIEPGLDRLGEQVERVGARVGEELRQLTELPGAWLEACRTQVRTQPVAAVAVAFAFGMLLTTLAGR